MIEMCSIIWSVWPNGQIVKKFFVSDSVRAIIDDWEAMGKNIRNFFIEPTRCKQGASFTKIHHEQNRNMESFWYRIVGM